MRYARAPVQARGTTGEYLAESSGFDQSITDTITARLPASWLIAALQLRFVDGRDLAYADPSGIVRFYDPTARIKGHSAALVDRAAFEAILEAQNLACVWAIGGEKNVYSDRGMDGFGGRVTYTRLHVLSDGVLTCRDRFQSVDRPTFSQLRALAGE